MGNYFYDMLPAEELARLEYIPTIPEFLDWIGKNYAERPALCDLQTTLTYSQLLDNVAHRRALINSLGLQKGAKIAIFERNSIDAVELFLAVTSAGYVAINLPSALPEPALIGSCRKFDVEAVFVRDEFAPLCEHLEGVKVLSSKATSEEAAPAVQVDKEDTAAIFFTGGTTGTPKGAILPHRAIMRGSFNGCFAPGSALCGHRTICMLPLSHVFGLIRSTMSVLYTGAEWFAAEDMKATIGKLAVIKPDVLVLVPGICEILVGLTKMYGPGFLGGELKMIISGAANVPPRLMTEFDKFGIKLLAGYGLTEGANFTAGNADTDTRPTSVGKIYPGQETKIVDGELWLKGDNIFKGYYHDPVNTEAAFSEDGWFRTGDLVRFDEDGYLYIVGRIKNLIILANGENVSPESLEEPFYADPCVRDAMVKEGEINGVPCIAIEILPNLPAFAGKPQEEIEAYMKALVDKVNATLPSTHRIAKMTVRQEDFKRTGSMKVARV